MNGKEELRKALETAYLDQTVHSNLAYRPEFLTNNKAQQTYVLPSLERELANCQEFCISVAFITKSGIISLKQVLKELERRGIPGKILTTDYLLFSDPEALETLQNLINVELRMYCSGEDKNGFHTKGYIFRREEQYRIIIGSSNLTASALKLNHEWNVKLIGYENGQMIERILEEFQQLWEDPHTKCFDQFFDSYKTRYELSKKQKELALQEPVVSLPQYTLEPNAMQVEFVQNILHLVESHETKALLISATGTGKTYASAFAIRELHPDKVLFLVHREQIAKQALESYKLVFGSRREDGSEYQYRLLSGSISYDPEDLRNADLVFATMQTMRQDEVLKLFPNREHFSVITLDEAHHSGANSYQKIMDYFRPKFWLGMTASPETTRFNVYEIFDYNIACEIRLQQALEQDLLCPFHYFGITDLCIDGQVIGDADNTDGLQYFNRLVSDDRVSYILEQAEYYGFSGDRLKGLIFCSSKREARELSVKFNARGYRTEALTGEDSEVKRESAIERLVRSCQEGTENDCLDYILTVDIFSEGVDIPEVNQVIMLRPTQSAIVFVQQLGRGLRKSQGKEFVVILDFIGNYKNNFLIPIALSGDRSYNKDNVRRYVMEGDRVIPGASTIHFDEISRTRIFSAIDSANFSDITLIRENYLNLKQKLGRIPALQDFDRYGEMDVCRIFDSPSLGSYYTFLKKYEKDYPVRLSKEEETILQFLSKKFASGKRIQELELLREMLQKPDHLIASLKQRLQEKHRMALTPDGIRNLVNVMTNAFSSGSGKSTYSDCVFLEPEEDEDEYRISSRFAALLQNPEFHQLVEELIAFGLSRYDAQYSQRYMDTDFVLYQKYTYEDVCRLLNWETNVVPLNIGGYKFDRKTKTFPVFINYNKGEEISDTTKYEDHFINPSTLIAISKSGRTQDSEDVQNFLHAEERGIAVHLFVRKNKDDKIANEFYYLGRMTASGQSKEFRMPNTTKTAVELEWILETPVRDDIYEYLIS